MDLSLCFRVPDGDLKRVFLSATHRSSSMLDYFATTPSALQLHLAISFEQAL